MFNNSPFNTNMFNGLEDDFSSTVVCTSTAECSLSIIKEMSSSIECISESEAILNGDFVLDFSSTIGYADVTGTMLGKKVYATRDIDIVNNTITYIDIEANGSADTDLTDLTLTSINIIEVDEIKLYNKRISNTQSTGNDIIDEYFKIINLYRSLKDTDKSLSSVRRNARRRLEAYGIYEDQTDVSGNPVDPIFSSDEDIKNAPVGLRGYVSSGATGVFKNKDGWYAIYLGKKIV